MSERAPSVGDIVMCISAGLLLRKNKLYEVKHTENNTRMIWVVNNDGLVQSFSSNRFINISVLMEEDDG